MAVTLQAEDLQLVDPDAARQFESELYRAITFAEMAGIRLSRLLSLHEQEDWPEGFEFSTDAVAAYAVIAQTLEDEAERMREMASSMRRYAPFLWLNHGLAAGDA